MWSPKAKDRATESVDFWTWREKRRITAIANELSSSTTFLRGASSIGIDAEPFLGYRPILARLQMQGHVVNRKAIQRIVQVKGLAMPSPTQETLLAAGRVERQRRAVFERALGTDATYIWTRFDGLVYLNDNLNCADRSCISCNISQRNVEKRLRRWRRTA